MDEIVRNRTIRPSSRLEKSKSYKIDTRQVRSRDILIVNIDHETKSFFRTYRFNGSHLANKDSISFRVNENRSSIIITWSGAQPIGELLARTQEPKPKSGPYNSIKPSSTAQTPALVNLRHSFEPLTHPDIAVLILGTMPGELSLQRREYYAHPRNLFWRTIAKITNNDIPIAYSEKTNLLARANIAVWDVARITDRKGSSDNAITNDEPNDLAAFISNHRKLKVIAFNGIKAAKLFYKHFTRKPSLKYLLLPSTSPANTSIGFEDICLKWAGIFDELR